MVRPDPRSYHLIGAEHIGRNYSHMVPDDEVRMMSPSPTTRDPSVAPWGAGFTSSPDTMADELLESDLLEQFWCFVHRHVSGAFERAIIYHISFLPFFPRYETRKQVR